MARTSKSKPLGGDAGVECGGFEPRSQFTQPPFLLAEVSSDSSFKTDLVLKAGEYLTLPSVQYYLVLDQEQPIISVFRRLGDEWTVHQAKTGDLVRIPEIGVELSVDELYEGAPFEEQRG